VRLSRGVTGAYLSWEVDLLERIKQDGTTRFVRTTGRINSH
jgi:hypothetical protein